MIVIGHRRLVHWQHCNTTVATAEVRLPSSTLKLKLSGPEVVVSR